METTLILGRLALAAVFVVAGLTKLRDIPGSRVTLSEFGVPRSVAGPGGLILPLLELAVAVSLLPASTAVWGSLASLALLMLFTVAVIASLARGRRPVCRCFGQLSATVVGLPTLLRNGLLTVLAAGVTWQTLSEPPGSVLGLLARLGVADVVLISAVVAAVGTVAVLLWLPLKVNCRQSRLRLATDELRRRHDSLSGGTMHETSNKTDRPSEPEGLPLGTRAPAFALMSLAGEQQSLTDLLRPDRPLLLVFTDPECGSCTALLPEIVGWQRALERRVSITVVGRGSAEANRVHATAHGVSSVLLQVRDEVADAYRVWGAPSAVLVWPDGTIGSPVAGGPDAIRSLVMHTAVNPTGPTWSPLLRLPTAEPPGHLHDQSDDRPEPLPVGAPAPAFELPDLDGQVITRAKFLDRQTLLLFWNPGCGSCHRLLPVMLAWEANLANLSERPVQLLVITDGSIDENRALGFRCAVVIDETLAVAKRIGVSDTPSAILISSEGLIASELAVGGPDILALANVALEPSR